MSKKMKKPTISAKLAESLLRTSTLQIGRNVKYLRTKLGLTQLELCHYMCTDIKQITRIESEKTYNLELITLVKLAHLLGISLEQLVSTSLIPKENVAA